MIDSLWIMRWGWMGGIGSIIITRPGWLVGKDHGRQKIAFNGRISIDLVIGG